MNRQENGEANRKVWRGIRWLVAILTPLIVGASVWYADQQVQNRAIRDLEEQEKIDRAADIRMRDDVSTMKADIRNILATLDRMERNTRGN